MARKRLAAAIVVLAAGLFSNMSAQEGEDPHAELVATYSEMNSFSPFFSVRRGLDAELFLMNTTQDPVLADLFARNPQGEEVALGRYVVPGAQHLELPLRDLVRGLGSEFEEGTIRLHYFGNKETLPSWVVLHSGEESLVLKLLAPEQLAGTTLLSFWDRRGVQGELNYLLTNTSNSTLNCTVTDARGRSSNFPIAARRQKRLRIDGTFGWLRISHDGRPGDLQGIGLLIGEELLASFPLATLDDAHRGPVYESISVTASARVSMFNPADRSQRVRAELLEQATGALLATEVVDLGAWQVASVDISRLTRQIVSTNGDFRLRIRGELPDLMVGSLEYVSFFSALDAHRMGTYPLASPDRYDVFTSIVNLRDEEATVVFQGFWNGGTFSYGPMTIPPRAAKVVHMDELVASPPDLLQRSFDPMHPNGLIKWVAKGRTASLLGRTEARVRDGYESFGFSCFGCCYESPFAGSTLPASVDFLPGQTPSFQNVYYLDTCSGTMGPFYPPEAISSRTVPSPFTWDGSHVGASGAKLATLSFSGREIKVKAPQCDAFEVPISGSGRANTCRVHLMGWNPNKTCASQTTTCGSCFGCCQGIYNYNICNGRSIDLATTELNACKGECVASKSC